MKKLLAIILLFLACSLNEGYAQFWQQTNGPGGAIIRSVGMSAEGDLYVWSNAFYRSTDNGHSWQTIAIPGNIDAITTGATNEVFIDVPYPPSGRGLWRSADRGDHWTKISNGILAAVLDGGAIYVSDTNGYLVSTDHGVSWDKKYTYGIELPGKFFIKSNGTQFLIAPQSILYRSDDTGRTWIKTTLPACTYLIFTPTGSIFSSAFLVAFSNYLFKSTDDGLSWKFDTIMSYPSTWSPYKCRGLFVSPSGRIVYLADNTPYFSDDDGKNWRKTTTVSAAVSRRDSTFFCFNSSNYSLLLGSLTPQNYGQVLSIPNGSAKQLYAFGNNTIIASGDQDWITTDDGEYWASPAYKVLHPTLRSNSSVVTDSMNRILALSDSSVLQSIDNGVTWSKLSTLIGIGQSIVIHPSGDIFAAVNNNGIFRSTDNGTTWKISNYGILESTVSAIAVDNNGALYAGAASGIYRSNDRGSTWAKESALPSKLVTSIVNDPVNARIVCAINGTVFLQSNDGMNWKSTTELPSSKIYQTLPTPAGYIFAATDSGVYFLDTGNTTTWQEINDVIGKKIAYALTINTEGRIFASTNGSGVFKSSQTFLTPHRLSKATPQENVGSLSVYPNPIEEISTIAFNTNRRTSIRFEVTDALGRIVKTIANTIYDEGHHTIAFDASNLSSGIYYINMIEGESRFSRKIIK